MNHGADWRADAGGHIDESVDRRAARPGTLRWR